MRRIEYRVWGKQASRYIGGMLLGETGGLYEMRLGSETSEENNEEYIIELYTGLNDKNGKKIYEGDIVKEHSNGLSRIGKVEWDNRYAGFCVVWDDNSVDEVEGTVTVIGNIHENPELLKEEEEAK